MVQQTGQKHANELITIAQNKHNQAAAGDVVSKEEEPVTDDSSEHIDNIIPEKREHEGVHFPYISSSMAENAHIDASYVNVGFESEKSVVW